MTDHLRTGGNAGFNCLQHQLHIQTSLFGNRKALRDTGNLDRAHQVVDQLVNRAGTDRTEMPDRGRERREIRPRSFEVSGLGADQQRQFSVCCSIRQPRDRTIDIDQTASTEFAREIKCVAIRHGGTFDRQCTGFGRRAGASLAEPHGARRFVIGDHRHDGIGSLGRIPRGRSAARAARNQILGF